jgi:hypothetical protein
MQELKGISGGGSTQTRAVDRPMTQMEARVDRLKEIAGNVESLAARISDHVNRITGPRAQPSSDAKMPSAAPGNEVGPIGLINSLDYQFHRVERAITVLNDEANNLDGIL